eukprot:TRINITY_DN22919_c0_g1_i2.p1 TRINITY_DN22919_c0_g1~~TRINITY_DN22919_c0_g1_i2.p1  ORF type:complete len:455 (-),score=45.68 TRINITY_DN22919_c0_g1_i2:217-1581(-)
MQFEEPFEILLPHVCALCFFLYRWRIRLLCMARPCQNGCGWSAFRDFPTCCSNCKGCEGPHAHDCGSKNSRLRPSCARNCGRPAFDKYPTCCTKCRGYGGPHADDCSDKCRASATALPEVMDSPVPGGGGYGGGGYGGGGAGHAGRGRKKALLVGINYEGTRAKLRGCVNDVHNIQKLLVETFHWKPDCIRTLTDDDARNMPTKRNMFEALHWLSHGARPGDVLFFHFSGHGAQQVDPNGYEESGMNETLLPVDFQKAGMISDDELSDIIVKPLPEGVRLTAVLDCCHSGTGLDLPFHLSKTHGWREEVNPYHTRGDVQMFSGCADDGTSADVVSSGSAGGAMTTAFCGVLREHREPGYVEFMKLIYENLRSRGMKQRPLLTTTQRFDINRSFDLHTILPNSNPKIGRTVRRKFEPKPRKMEGPLAELLAGAGFLGVALMGGLLLAGAVGALRD